MKVKWTEEQQKVIDLRNRNILVSAAAGSGKTAVLVERIIAMLTDAKEPVDVDRLLVVTFTEAAAAEMKERIRGAVEARAEAEPENERIRRQATLIHSAQITTIHSFCLSVIREHFHSIDLDPAFRIGEEGELKLLRQEALLEALEEYYAEGDERFLNLVDGYGGSRDDKKIEELTLRLYEFSRSYPEPEKWLDGCKRAYEAESLEELEKTPGFKRALENVDRYVEGAKELISQAVGVCRNPDGPYMYEETLEQDSTVLETLQKQRTYEDFYRFFQNLKWARLAANKDKTLSEEKTGQVKGIREEVKSTVKDLGKLYFSQPGQEVLKDLERCRPIMEILAELTGRFSERFQDKKRSRNMIDFDDMQQYALKILTREEEGRLVPSDVAREYQEQFAEVMIDEYQDSNLIQEAILTSVSRMEKGQNNIFMVGDVKQSIYRFRLSRPELFMEKYDRYPLKEAKEQRIDLHKNFRSRGEVLESVNYIFRRIMTRTLGGVEYDDSAALYAGAAFLENEGTGTELLLVEPEERAAAKETEAKAVGARIKKLMAEQMVEDKQTKTLRPIQYKDIVILTRSMKGFAEILAQTLKKSGVPVYTANREGYFETREIGLLLEYLRVLNNRRQDLPLAAVLKSCFGNLTEEDLAVIKGQYRELKFYQAVETYRQEGKDKEIRRKLEKALRQMESFREMAPYMAMDELLERIFQETGYLDYTAALPAGEQREANLYMLVEKARAFENTSYKGLFHFIRYVEQLKKYEIEYGEANTSDEQADTVRIMSIHKSKGLEFPVVIAAGMGKGFNRQDSRGSMLMHASLGVGLDAVDLQERTKCPSFIKSVIAKEELLENMGEELRVLYVALTRAKEKLIMTGTLESAGKKLLEGEIANEKIPFGRLAGAASYLDWLIPAATGEDSPIRIEVLSSEDILKQQIEERAGELFTRQALERWDTERVYDEEMSRSLKEQFSYRYPHEDLEGKKMKYTVSELKKRAYLSEEAGELLYEEEPVVPLIPKFLQEEETLSGASRGSAYHRIMELLDFSEEYDRDKMEETIGKMAEEGKISKDMALVVRAADVLTFVESASGRRMKRAAREGTLKKEQPFVLGIPMEELYAEMKGKEQEMILVQGIIDAYFEEEDGLVVLDYKTDKVRAGRELLEKYQTQLDYYARALEQITGKRVKEKIIYSFTLQEEIIWE